jgi:PAS domain S-box-containing protein
MYCGEARVLSSLAQQSGAKAGIQSAQDGVALLEQSHRWGLWLVIVAVAGGTGLLVANSKYVASRRRAWGTQVEAWDSEWRKIDAQWRKTDADWRQTVERLECQLVNGKKSAEQLYTDRDGIQRRAEELALANAQLQAELDQLKRTRLTLTQKQQALETSRTVLELHVETRTKDLQQLQGRYELILNSAGEGICGLDAQGKTAFANPTVARLTGWKPEELIGKTEQQIFGRSSSEIWGALANRPSAELVFQRKDGTNFPVEFVKTTIKESDRVVGAVVIFRDITERKQGEEALAHKAAELARSNAELEQFAFVASHDLQEPLRKIQAFGDRLKTKCDGAFATDARDYLERMQGAAGRMRTLIDDLLAFSRVIRSAEPFIPVDLAAVTKEVLSDLEVRIEKSGARVEVTDLPTIEADPTQMRQLLLNLVGNSLKFQSPGGTPIVKIQARTLRRPWKADTAFLRKLPASGGQPSDSEQFCELTVEDNGIGFEEKYAEKVFAVFQRLHGRDQYEGNGVGLAVCRRIADHHQGTIQAKSQLGQGATFIVTLPFTHPKTEPST